MLYCRPPPCLLNSVAGKNRPILYSTFINAIIDLETLPYISMMLYKGVTWRGNTIWLGQLYMEPGWGGGVSKWGSAYRY